MCTMETMASYCLTEPNAGSDAANLSTKAVVTPDGESYVLSGEKAFISGGGSSDLYIVMARTGDGGASGVSCFVVEAAEAIAKGTLSFGAQEKKLGWNTQPTCAVILDELVVPKVCGLLLRSLLLRLRLAHAGTRAFTNAGKFIAYRRERMLTVACLLPSLPPSLPPLSSAHPLPKANRLAGEGEGFKIAMKGLDGGRLSIGCCSMGAAQACFDKARAHVGIRKQFGAPLSANQSVQFKLAEMATSLTTSRLLLRHAARALDAKESEARELCAMAKKVATDSGFAVCNEALQLHGGYGYLRDYGVERFLRDVRVHQILEGTNEIMSVIIGRELTRNN